MQIDHCEFPDELLYDLERGTWAKPRGNSVRVGVTSIVSWSYGPIGSVTFKDLGTPLRRGQVLGALEGTRHFDVFRSPIGGTLSAVNLRLVDEPTLLNTDPYGEGWFAEIMASDTRMDSLTGLPQARGKLTEMMEERHVRCFAAFPDKEMYEIGVECSGVLIHLNDLLEKNPRGTVVHVVSDDATADLEMERWSDQTGNPVLDRRSEGNLYHFIVKRA